MVTCQKIAVTVMEWFGKTAFSSSGLAIAAINDDDEYMNIFVYFLLFLLLQYSLI